MQMRGRARGPILQERTCGCEAGLPCGARTTDAMPVLVRTSGSSAVCKRLCMSVCVYLCVVCVRECVCVCTYLCVSVCAHAHKPRRPTPPQPPHKPRPHAPASTLSTYDLLRPFTTRHSGRWKMSSRWWLAQKRTSSCTGNSITCGHPKPQHPTSRLWVREHGHPLPGAAALQPMLHTTQHDAWALAALPEPEFCCTSPANHAPHLCLWHAPHGRAHGHHIVGDEALAVPLLGQVGAQVHAAVHVVLLGGGGGVSGWGEHSVMVGTV